MPNVVISGFGIVDDVGFDGACRISLGSRAAEASCSHPFAAFPVEEEIPIHSDRRAMGLSMQAAVFAAGRALKMAGVVGDTVLLNETQLLTAGKCLERDAEVDNKILQEFAERSCNQAGINAALMGLRPTFFLAQLPNLISANICIVHAVTGRSQTFLGEELAGVEVVATAFDRIAAGVSQRCLTGAVFSLEDPSFAETLAGDPTGPLVGPAASCAVYLVLESETSARARGCPVRAHLRSSTRGALDRGDPEFTNRFESWLMDALADYRDESIVLNVVGRPTQGAQAFARDLWQKFEPSLPAAWTVKHLSADMGARFEAAVPFAVQQACQGVGARRTAVVGLGVDDGEAVFVVEASR